MNVTQWESVEGRCDSELNYEIGTAENATRCWEMCLFTFEEILTAIDWWAGGIPSQQIDAGACFCQNTCDCMQAVDANSLSRVSSDVITVDSISALPEVCEEEGLPTTWGKRSGRCTSNLNRAMGLSRSLQHCWEICEREFGDVLVAVDRNDNPGECYCQDACDCMADQDQKVQLATRGSLTELPDSCEEPVRETTYWMVYSEDIGKRPVWITGGEMGGRFAIGDQYTNDPALTGRWIFNERSNFTTWYFDKEVEDPLTLYWQYRFGWGDEEPDAETRMANLMGFYVWKEKQPTWSAEASPETQWMVYMDGWEEGPKPMWRTGGVLKGAFTIGDPDATDPANTGTYFVNTEFGLASWSLKAEDRQRVTYPQQSFGWGSFEPAADFKASDLDGFFIWQMPVAVSGTEAWAESAALPGPALEGADWTDWVNEVWQDIDADGSGGLNRAEAAELLLHTYDEASFVDDDLQAIRFADEWQWYFQDGN